MIDVTIIQQQQQQQTIIGRFEKTIRNVRTQHKKKKKVRKNIHVLLHCIIIYIILLHFLKKNA